jgi:hypothetical protein
LLKNFGQLSSPSQEAVSHTAAESNLRKSQTGSEIRHFLNSTVYINGLLEKETAVRRIVMKFLKLLLQSTSTFTDS